MANELMQKTPLLARQKANEINGRMQANWLCGKQLIVAWIWAYIEALDQGDLSTP